MQAAKSSVKLALPCLPGMEERLAELEAQLLQCHDVLNEAEPEVCFQVKIIGARQSRGSSLSIRLAIHTKLTRVKLGVMRLAKGEQRVKMQSPKTPAALLLDRPSHTSERLLFGMPAVCKANDLA